MNKVKTSKKKSPVKKEMPVIFNIEGLKKAIKTYLNTLTGDDSKDEYYETLYDRSSDVLHGFLNYIAPNHDGLLNIYNIIMDGSSDAVVIAYSSNDAKEILKEENHLHVVKSIKLLGEASKGQTRGVVTYDPGLYV